MTRWSEIELTLHPKLNSAKTNSGLYKKQVLNPSLKFLLSFIFEKRVIRLNVDHEKTVW